MNENLSDTGGYWDKKQTAKHFAVSISTLNRLMAKGKVPFVRFGHRTVRFNPSDLKAATAKLTVVNSARARLRG